MKKILALLAIALPLVLASCGNEPDGPITISQENLALTIDETVQLTASEKGTWTSSNEFVATVDGDGNVTALHVGEAVITITKGDLSASCKVVVNPANTSYDLPYMVWGATVEDVKVANTNLSLFEETTEDGETILSYLTDSNLPGYIYVVTPAQGLIATALVADINDSENFEDFLYQYFADFTEDDEWYYLINGLTENDATIAVQYGWNDDESVIATFMPIDLAAETPVRSSNIKSMFDSVKFNKSIFKNI